MSTETNNQEGGAQPQQGAGEGANTSPDIIQLKKDEYNELVEMKASYGSLKREFKDLKKSLEKPADDSKETPKNQPNESRLLEKSYLRAAGIAAEDEVELALSTAKKWGIDVDKLVDDEDFKVKLEKLRTQKTNELATSNVRGSGSTNQAKNSPEYWIAKGTPPSVADIPDRKTRAKIARAMMQNAKSGKKFYND